MPTDLRRADRPSDLPRRHSFPVADVVADARRVFDRLVEVEDAAALAGQIATDPAKAFHFLVEAVDASSHAAYVHVVLNARVDDVRGESKYEYPSGAFSLEPREGPVGDDGQTFAITGASDRRDGDALRRAVWGRFRRSWNVAVDRARPGQPARRASADSEGPPAAPGGGPTGGTGKAVDALARDIVAWVVENASGAVQKIESPRHDNCRSDVAQRIVDGLAIALVEETEAGTLVPEVEFSSGRVRHVGGRTEPVLEFGLDSVGEVGPGPLRPREVGGGSPPPPPCSSPRRRVRSRPTPPASLAPRSRRARP